MSAIPLEFDVQMFLRLLIAAVLGALVGYERERAGKPAGVRTHGMVSLGAALFRSRLYLRIWWNRRSSARGRADCDRYRLSRGRCHLASTRHSSGLNHRGQPVGNSSHWPCGWCGHVVNVDCDRSIGFPPFAFRTPAAAQSHNR